MPASLNALRKGTVQCSHYFVIPLYPNLSNCLSSAVLHLLYLCSSLVGLPILLIEGGFLVLSYSTWEPSCALLRSEAKLSCLNDLEQSHQKVMERC